MAALPPPFPKLLPNETSYDDHTQPHRGTTVPQLTLFIVWIAAIVLWVLGRASKANLLPTPWSPAALETDDVLTKPESEEQVSLTINGVVQTSSSVDQQQTGKAGNGQTALAGGREVQCRTTTNSAASSGKGTVATPATKQNFSAIIPPPSFEQFLQQIVLLGVIMIYFWLCDYRKVNIPCCSLLLCLKMTFGYYALNTVNCDTACVLKLTYNSIAK